MKIYHATVDPTYPDDGAALCVAEDAAQADELFTKAGYHGAAKRVDGLPEVPGPARVIPLP